MFHNKKILVVEDNKLNQKILSFWLSKENYPFQITETGEKAIELFKNEWFDIVVMDLMLPGMSGFETSKIFRKIENELYYRHTFIIALTANTLDKDKDHCLLYGMDAYLAKPFDMNELNHILETLFSR
jgi:CheY-like chemotaxis protein